MKDVFFTAMNFYDRKQLADFNTETILVTQWCGIFLEKLRFMISPILADLCRIAFESLDNFASCHAVVFKASALWADAF